ncbi:phosphotyrosine protein phosphatase [Paraoerskovia sediminicola]|uniref:protein-tyrosine-phosphatase n=1 Tax=Paraoerskovia sediminicola TaxID=1138587 RepID=A0ABM8G1Z4_9CELL|nr:low molecular weight protein-tyrosine-phosphatase [Paraoerskovia sediminicola]BDZ42135.1 phosphotyrosine protein phosphatase [Paraoerskovia sediminicola]
MSDSPRTFRIMTVCTGNICRSPMAEVVLRDRFERAGLGDVVAVDSTGISDEESGNPIDVRARKVLERAGYTVPDRSARQVTATDLVGRDLVLPMTSVHARALRRLEGKVSRGAATGTGELDPAELPKIRMYRSFDPQAPEVVDEGSEHELDIDDPWYGGAEDFETCLAQVEAAADEIVAAVRGVLDPA